MIIEAIVTLVILLVTAVIWMNKRKNSSKEGMTEDNGKMKRQCPPDTSVSNLCAAKQVHHQHSTKAFSSSDPPANANVRDSSGLVTGDHAIVHNHIYNYGQSEQSTEERRFEPQTIALRSKQKEDFSDEDSSNLSDKDKFKTLLQVCSWIHEANVKNLSKDIVAHLPDHIVFPQFTKILPSDVFNMFHALRPSSKSHTMDVDGCNFTGDSLKLFSKEVSSFKIKIQYFGLQSMKLSDEDVSSVVEISQHVEEVLRLRGCGITSCQVSSLAEGLSETGHKIQNLILSYNNFGDEGFSNLVQCLKNIQRLVLGNCGISSAGCAKFAEKLMETGHNLEYLNLSFNELIGDGARSLIPCLHLIEELRLSGCEVTETVEEEIRSELKRLGLPEYRVWF